VNIVSAGASSWQTPRGPSRAHVACAACMKIFRNRAASHGNAQSLKWGICDGK
jgi:hypothetical protein